MTFMVNASMLCNVKNVIYVITRRSCHENYTGDTNLRHCTTVHNQQIREINTRKIPLSEQIDTCLNEDPRYLVFSLYKVQMTDNAEETIRGQFC